MTGKNRDVIALRLREALNCAADTDSMRVRIWAETGLPFFGAASLTSIFSAIKEAPGAMDMQEFDAERMNAYWCEVTLPVPAIRAFAEDSRVSRIALA